MQQQEEEEEPRAVPWWAGAVCLPHLRFHLLECVLRSALRATSDMPPASVRAWSALVVLPCLMCWVSVPFFGLAGSLQHVDFFDSQLTSAHLSYTVVQTTVLAVGSFRQSVEAFLLHPHCKTLPAMLLTIEKKQMSAWLGLQGARIPGFSPCTIVLYSALA